MRPFRWGPVLIAACVLAPMAMAAAFEPGEGKLLTGAPPLLTGVATVAAREGAIVWSGPSARGASLSLHATEGRLEIVHVQTQVVRGPLGDVALAPERTVETYSGLRGEVFLLPTEGFEAALHVDHVTPPNDGSTSDPPPTSSPPTSLKAVADVDLAALAATEDRFSYSYRMNASLPFYHTVTQDAPGLRLGREGLLVDGAQVTATGTFTFFVTGARVRATSEDGDVDALLGERRHETIGAWGPGTDAYTFAVLTLVEGAFTATSRGDALAAHLVTDEVEVVGRVRCTPCDAQLLVGGTRYVASGSRVDLDGEIAIRAPPRGGREYLFEGSVDAAQLGRGLHYESPPTLTFLGILAALALLLHRNLGELAARGLATLYTRITRNDVLSCVERRELADRVAAKPGLHLRALQREVGFGWGKLHYHLRVLEWAGIVRRERRGRLVHVHPVGHAAVDPRMGARARLLPRGAALKVFDALPEGVPSTSADVARVLGISRQLAGHHLRRLEQEGLAERVGVSPRRFRRVVRGSEKQGSREVR